MNLLINCIYEIFCCGLNIFIEDDIKIPCTLKFHNNALKSLNPNFYYVYRFPETWSLAVREERKLGVFENMV